MRLEKGRAHHSLCLPSSLDARHDGPLQLRHFPLPVVVHERYFPTGGHNGCEGRALAAALFFLVFVSLGIHYERAVGELQGLGDEGFRVVGSGSRCADDAAC
jgi:hypothetical protein